MADAYWGSPFGSSGGIVLKNDSYFGTEKDDTVLFAFNLFYRNPYNSSISLLGGNDAIEFFGTGSMVNLDLGEGDVNAFKTNNDLRYSSLYGGNGSDLFLFKSSGWGVENIYRSSIHGNENNDIVIIEKDTNREADEPAVEGSIIDLGDGDDLIGVSSFGLTFSGNSDKPSIIDLGEGDDVLKFILLEANYPPIYASNLFIDAGDGDDEVDLSQTDPIKFNLLLLEGGNGFDVLKVPDSMSIESVVASGFEKIISGSKSKILNHKPIDLNFRGTSLDENIAAGSVVATLSTTDQDSGDTHTYSLASGDGSEDNGCFDIVGNELKIKESPDFETQASYSVRLKTTDSGGLTFEKALMISVNDMNEAPSGLSVSTSNFNEDIAGGSAVATLNTIDPDADESFSYALVSGSGDTDNNSFTIEGDHLNIKVSPDFESKFSYNIRLQAKDLGGLTFEKEFTLVVNDLDEIPTPEPQNPVYRLYNSSQGKHLFSSNQFEIDLLTGDDWQNEGVIYYAPEEGTADVFRFFIPSEARHFYTALEFERDFIINNQDAFSGWQYEGPAFSAYSTSDYPEDAVAVVRYFNIETGSHVYSTSFYEQGILDQNASFMNEGIAWFGDPMVATESLL